MRKEEPLQQKGPENRGTGESATRGNQKFSSSPILRFVFVPTSALEYMNSRCLKGRQHGSACAQIEYFERWTSHKGNQRKATVQVNLIGQTPWDDAGHSCKKMIPRTRGLFVTPFPQEGRVRSLLLGEDRE